MPHVCVNLTIHDRHGRTSSVRRNLQLPAAPRFGAPLPFPTASCPGWAPLVKLVVEEPESGYCQVELNDWASDNLSLEAMLRDLGSAWQVRWFAA